MSKKILFMSSAKLTTISLGLLLAVFCTIGMSFRPVYGEDEAELVMAGPRMSHWHWTTTTGSGCNQTKTQHYQSSVDYAETKVQTRGNGSATISTTETANVTSATSASTTTTAGNTASISWNSGLSHNDQTTAEYTPEQIIAAHKKVFTLTAEPINADYYFLGWGTSTSESSIVSADNPYTVTSNMGITGYTDANSQPANYATKTYTETYYAFFKERLPANITLKLPTNGTVKYSYESYSNVTLSAETTITTKADLTLVAVPDENCYFYGWYTLDGTTENFISTSATYTRAYPDDITIYAKFVPNSQATFNIKGTDQYFYDLGQACAAAASSSSKIVYPIADGTVPAGNYTIPSGVTLLIPYEGTKLEKLTEPAYKYFSSGTPDAPSCYRKLILLDGANITCNGTICVAGQIASLGGGSPSGYPFGACGVLDMSNGGHIELNNGSYLYAWGFVKGQDMDQGNNTIGVGTITANSGAKVYEDFCGENRGGSACSALASDLKSYRSFPFQGYAVQNIEVPVTYRYQSTLNVYAAMYIQGDIKKSFPLVSNSGSLFLVQNGTSYVKKWYDPTTDLACYELSGTAKLDAISTKIYVSVNSAEFNLPISSNMHIIFDNCTMELANPVQVLPDAVIEIRANATAIISSNLFLYDKDDWRKGIGKYYFASFKNLTSHKNRGDGTSNATLNDAKLIVDGTLNVTGKLYTTTGGANICGNGGGTITFGSLPTASNIYQCWDAVGGTASGAATYATSFNGTKTYIHAVPVNAANLCNEDDSYTQSVASTTFHNVNGRWFAAANKDVNASTHVYDHFIYISDGQPVSGSSGTTTDTKAVYAPDKTGLAAGMKWCNVAQDATCGNIYNATQSLNGTAAADIRYTYPSSSWVQLLKTETPSVCEGSDNNLYAIDGCTVTSLGSVDENCLYTLEGVKKAIVNGQFVALAKNTEDEAWHNTAATTEYYISFAGCIWHSATKYPNEEKAYIVEGDNYIWYNNDWLLVENESGMFFDYNEQNVKRYYEYENGAWVLATPYVRVKDDIETREFFKFDEAVTVASGKKNTIITLLKDVPCTTMATYSAKNTTCTLDLNNHTVHGACATLLKIDASGTTFTITDNSDEKNGRLENFFAQNAVTYGINLTAAAKLDIDTGTVYVENPAQYASKAATVNGVAVTALASCGARAVQVAAAQKLNLKKGSLEAYATRNAYGIVATGNTANTTQVTITGGKVYAEAPCGAYGISCTGKLDMSAGLVEAKLNDHLVDAAFVETDASNNLNKHQTCYTIIMGGSASATASSCFYGTLTVTGGKIKASSDLVRSYTSNVHGIYMNVSVAGMGNRNNASTSKTNSEQACSKGSIKNATIEVQNNGNYGYGIIVLGKYNSKDKSNTTIQVENTNVTVKANNYAYGIYASGTINGTTGECSSSDVELTNCTVWAEAEKAAGAYATWVWAGYTTIYQDKQANYYGEYAAGAKMTINSGTYTAKTKTTSAYATGTSLRAKSIYDPTSSTTWGPGEGKEAKATLIIKGGTFLGEATTTTARAVSNGGDCTITGGNFTAIAGTTTAYGLYCQSGKLTATGVPITVYAKGRASSSDNNAYAYGAMADVSIIGSGNQAWTGYACAGEIELNNCTINDTATTYANARGVMVNASSVMLTRANFDKQKTTSSWSTATYNQYNSVFPVQVQGKDSIWVGIAAKATINGGTINVTAHTTTAYGAFVNRALKYSYTKPNTILDEYQGQLEINNATFVVKTETSTTAEGVRAYGPTTITGGSFTVQPSGATAYGLKVYAGKTTVNGSPEFNVTATTTAYGIMAGGGDQPADKTGALYNGEVEVNGGTFNVETTSDKPAYGVYVYGNSRPITSTAAGYYAGNYASAGKAVINDGVFNVKSKKTEAYGIYMSPTVSQSGASGYATATATPTCTINGGTFTAQAATDAAYGAFVSNGATLTVTDGTIKGELTAVAADKFAVGAYIAAGGKLEATGGTFEAEAAKSGLTSAQKSYACGLYSPDGTATISASNAIFKGELKSNYLSNGGASTWSGGAYGVYARTTNPLSLTNCTITGNSAYQGGFGLRFANTPAEVRNCNITVTTMKAYNYGLFVGGADCDVKLYDCDFTCTSGTTYAYGIYAYNGATYAENCTIDATVQRTGASSAADSYLYGVLVAAGKTATLKDCSITATGSGKYSNNGYGIYVDGTANLDNCDVAVSNINSNAYALFNTANTTLLNVVSGKYKATATSGATSTNGTVAAAKQTLNGGYYSHNTNLAKYAVAPKKVLTLRESHTLYPDYKYTINEGGTVTWKNGEATLKTEMYESGETPAYTGETPTKATDERYSYTHSGWTPTLGAMANADKTYTATFNQTEQKYAVTVVSGGHGSVSPASVSNIGCVTASGDITATPDAGYSFSNWTLPDGVTAADGYTSESNPIHIHATASGKTITANFAAKNYTVTLDDQSATTAGQASVTATYDAAMPSIAANLPAKTGHTFGGYYSAINGGGTQYYNGTGASARVWDMDAASPTLYAKWTPQTYNITYKDKGNVAFSGVHGSDYPTKHTYGTATALVDPSREGYIFEGWFTSQDCSTGQVATLGATAYTADITLYAKWRQNKVTVTWDATTNGGTAADPATTKVTPGEAVGTLATTSKTGHSYKWYTAPTGGTEVTAATKVSEDKTFYAQFTANTHKLAWNFNGGTPSGDYTEANDALAYGSTITYPSLNKTGYTFAGWSTDVTSMPDADLTITASWNPNTNTAYKVEHYWQNINDDEYTKHETVDMTGTTDAATAAVAKSYTGFEAAQAFVQGTIAPDGSTVVKIYYNRKTYLITWEVTLNGEQEAYKEETLRYGAMPLYGETPTKESSERWVYTFSGWSPEPYKVDKAQEYSGSFHVDARPYLITFVNDDNTTVLQSSQVGWGSTPEYSGGTPVSTIDASYEFIGWTPAITAVAEAATYVATYKHTVDSINVVSGDTVTINMNTVTTTTTVHVAGELIVEDGKTLSTNDLILEASAETSGEIVKTGAIKADNIYFDLILNNPTNRRWNAFTVPFRVDLRKSGKPVILNGETLTLGRGYDIVYYDGSVRAERGPVAACWKYVEDGDSILYPGRAYMIASASRAIQIVRFTAADVETAFNGGEVHVDENPSTTGNVTDGGWNGIGNPMMYHSILNAGVDVCQVHDGGPIGADGYHMYVMTDKKFVVGKAVYVQVETGQDVDVSQAGNQTVIPAHAPRRTRAEINAERFDVNIAPVDAEVADHIFVLYEENKADEYVILSDLAKAGVSTVRAQMWVDRYGEKLCKNTTALIKNRADYPLGIYAPQSGEYEIFLNGQANENANLYLTYDGKVIWNLNYGGYTASLEAGTNTRYGLRLVRTTAAVVTGIEEATIENGDDIRKVIVEDKVYIIRNGEIYSVTGQKAQ